MGAAYFSAGKDGVKRFVRRVAELAAVQQVTWKKAKKMPLKRPVGMRSNVSGKLERGVKYTTC